MVERCQKFIEFQRFAFCSNDLQPCFSFSDSRYFSDKVYVHYRGSRYKEAARGTTDRRSVPTDS